LPGRQSPEQAWHAHIKQGATAVNDDWIGLIPAAGKGVRLGLPYPKELYPIIRDNHYKPIAQYVLNSLTTARVNHVVFVINETKHQLMGFFGDGHRFGCNISYVVQESNDEQNKSTSPGLAHALNSAYHLIRGRTVFFGMADTIMQPANIFARAFSAAKEEDDAILGLFATERPEKFGMVRMDCNQKIVEIVDKPQKTELTHMWGCIIWRPRFTEYLYNCVCRRQISDFAGIMNGAIDSGMHFRGVKAEDGTYIDLGTYEEIMELDLRMRQE
jgi:glucose-1-phosphate thymidylyltransferase